MLWFGGTSKQSVVLNSQAFIRRDRIYPGSGVGGHLRFKDHCLPCAMNILVNTRQGRRVAQAALKLCRSFERRDLRTFISVISLNAELVSCRTSTPWKSRQHKRRPRRSRDYECAVGAMDSKRKVEVFSGGCAFCHEVIDVVRREAGSSSQIILHNIMDARSLQRAEVFGIRSVPAVVIDGKLAACCTGKGVDFQVLKNELGKTG